MDRVLQEILPNMYDFVLYICNGLGDLWNWLFKDFTISFGALDFVIDFLPITAKPIYIIGGLAVVVALFKNIFL